MALPVSATLVINPKEGFELVWGGAVRAYNWCARTDLQPTTAVYMANFSVVSGDCTGWQSSLRIHAENRSPNGFQLGSLLVGYPGQHALSELLSSEYGTRWLGLLSVISTVRDENAGGECLQALLKATAADATKHFVLSKHQCGRLWTLSREIFLDSPFWYEILSIISNISMNSNLDLVKGAFPMRYDRNWLCTFMVPACRLWEMAMDPRTSRKRLWARGYTGWAQLVFYLSTVCGFLVTLRSSPTHIQVGDKTQGVEVVMTIECPENTGECYPWQVGYLLDDVALEQALPTVVDLSKWRPGAAAYKDRHVSDHRVQLEQSYENIDCTFLLTQVNALKRDIAGTGLESYLSKSLAEHLHESAYFWVPRSESWIGTERTRKPRSQIQSQILAERTERGVQLFAPGLIQEKHLEDALRGIRNDAPAEKPRVIANIVQPEMFNMVCGCPSHGKKPNPISCFANTIEHKIKAICRRVWIASWISVNAHVLRNVGPDYQWQASRNIAPSQKQGSRSEIHGEEILEQMLGEIATRLSGSRFQASQDENELMAATAGGYIVGISGNEYCDPLEDPGHSFYLIPGAIEGEDTHATEVYQLLGANRELGPWVRRRLHDAQESIPSVPSNSFGKSKLEHRVETRDKRALVSSQVVVQGGTIPYIHFATTDALTNARTMSSCLGQCAKGQLTVHELQSVQQCGLDEAWTFPSGLPKQVQLVLTRGNRLVQRALIARNNADKIMILTGDCVHCALRAALIEGMTMLLC